MFGFVQWSASRDDVPTIAWGIDDSLPLGSEFSEPARRHASAAACIRHATRATHSPPGNRRADASELRHAGRMGLNDPTNGQG
jgi:hypothetical protein